MVNFEEVGVDFQSETGPVGTRPIFGNIFLRYGEEFYFGFRLLFAFLLAPRGAQKAFLM